MDAAERVSGQTKERNKEKKIMKRTQGHPKGHDVTLDGHTEGKKIDEENGKESNQAQSKQPKHATQGPCRNTPK